MHMRGAGRGRRCACVARGAWGGVRGAVRVVLACGIESASKGSAPVTSWWSVMPSAHTSAGMPWYAPDVHISGA
eukprot:3143287-Prymnesium_polylepis.1